MMKKSIFFLSLSLLAPACALAQADERTDVHRRNDCRLAGQIVETGQPDPHRTWALETLRLCNETGGAALAVLWTQTPASDAERNLLFRTSAELLDERLFNAVRSVATDASRATNDRLNALRVLATFVEPRFMVKLEQLRPDSEWSGGFTDHRVQRVGTVPLPTTAAADIRALLGQLAGNDSDPTVRHAAKKVLDALP